VEPRALQSIALAVAEARSVDLVLQRIVAGLAGEPGIALARIWLIAPGDICSSCVARAECRDQTRCLHLLASAGRSVDDSGGNWNRLTGDFRRIPLNVWKVGRIGGTGTPTLMTANLATDPAIHRPNWAKAEGIVAFAGQPLIFKGEILGVLAVFSRAHIDQDQFEWLRTFADHAAVAIANAQVFDELTRLQAELAHVNRVTAMGQLAASISHEVMQPITAGINNAEAALNWLRAQPPNLDGVRDALGEAVKEGTRALDVIGRIRALIGKAPPRKDACDVNEVILEVVGLTRGETAKHNISVLTQLTEELPRIRGDKVQLQQVILNLIINAVDAMSSIGKGSRALSISTGKDVGGVLVTVRDSGPGISPENHERLFDAFYTTKADGMGMGLSICRSIVEAHGGRIWASRDFGQGATFQFSLPLPGA